MNYGTCKACGAPIVWIRTVAGKNMPCEEKAVFYREKLGVKDRIVTPNGEVLACEYVDDQDQATGIGYIPHWANCTGQAKGSRHK